jgi:glycosyltransferase involved in cell wall biosynthesis
MSNTTDIIPKVSVVMITYKHEAFIAEAIEGVLMQEVEFPVEFIIADDCSPDRISEIVQEYIDKHPKGHWIKYTRHDANKGMMPNFIWALKQAAGKYIALCDGDDYWTNPNKLALQLDVLNKSPEFSLCFHNSNIIYENNIIGKTNNTTKSVFTTEDLFQAHFISTSSVVFRNILEYPEWFPKVTSGDKAVLLLISLHGQFFYIPETLSVYRSHPGGISNTHFGIKKVYEMSTLLNYFDEYTNYRYTAHCQKSLFHEVETHLLPRFLENLKTTYYIRELLKRIYSKIISLFAFKK